ncbi:Protein arv1 [Termitomyces sp. J132]|nr:Protein arv1 [Termitomyces sp. J132]
MPICTTCTSYVPYLYTEYESAYNLRLEQCVLCHCFADPYVEHDSLMLLLDLILLKRGVYRHLLYNRGTKPRRPTEIKETCDVNHRAREKERWTLVLQLSVTLIFLDACMMLVLSFQIHTDKRHEKVSCWLDYHLSYLQAALTISVETVAFHLAILVACYFVLRLVSLVQTWRYRGAVPKSSDIKREFRFSLVSLTLFYSSLTKLFLLFLLTVWCPTPSLTSLNEPWGGEYLYDNVLVNALKVLSDEEINREWIIRNVLGGMSAGFSLRVVLDIEPMFTFIVILVGWRVKTSVTNILSTWVGGNSESAGKSWRMYSIP